MKRLFVPVLALLVCLVAMGSEALAGVLWTIDWTAVSPNVVGDGGVNRINFSNQPAVGGEGTSDFTASKLNFKLPVDGTGDFFTHQVYALQLKLTDDKTGLSKTLDFGGDLNGPLAPKGSVIENTFNSPNTYEFDLGAGHYKVVLNSYVAPGIPDGKAYEGAIGGRIYATPVDDSGTPNDAPEPTSLLLAGLGAAGLGVRAWRKRKLLTA